jgi:ribosomal protein S18 acetylase RimI-like enzyme
MITFRFAGENDAAAVAALHAKSWQQNYRGVFSDHYLDHEVKSERLSVWKERLANPPENQFVHVAEIDDEFVGFVCGYMDHHPEYGTLIDNLHVHSEFIGQRIGERLMVNAAAFLEDKNRASMYLWVLVSNAKAIKFYERIGGKPRETVNDFDIGDQEITKTRYFWPDLKFILSLSTKE